ncbi:MAG TPA: hypothetical protein VFW98_05595 [Gemmatimonadaceae bacterium]|nr:hypothetical protein [Gemmatimonadaceae bacterium]
MPTIDATESPFYAWLDRPAIRGFVRDARSLTPGERLVLIKGLIPGLVEDMGEGAVRTFLEELATKAQRYAEAVANPGQGGATRRTPSEPLGGPVPGREAHYHLPGTRNPRRPGGRVLERQWEAAAWEKMQGGLRA